MTELSDELLVAYVDGQLAREQTRAVEKVLKHDDVIARRVDALKEAHARLESAFEAILAGEVSDLTLRAEPRIFREELPRTNKTKSVIGVLLVAAAAGVAGYYAPAIIPELAPLRALTQTPKQSERVLSTWQDDAARAHALLSRASLEVGLDSQGNRDLVAFQLTHALGDILKVPDLEPQGLRFVRAQLLHYGGKPVAQMLYLGKSGNPIALYASLGDGENQPSFSKAGNVGMVSWAEQGIAYLLAGDDDEALLLRLASKISLEPVDAIPEPPAKIVEPSPPVSTVVAPPWPPQISAPAASPAVTGSTAPLPAPAPESVTQTPN